MNGSDTAHTLTDRLVALIRVGDAATYGAHLLAQIIDGCITLCISKALSFTFVIYK